MEKQKSPTWSPVKKQLANLETKDLLEIIGQLYKLNQDNKVFLTSRFVALLRRLGIRSYLSSSVPG